MLLSVVIPTYNRQDSLRVTLEALVRQTVPVDDFEVIVVSDGSTDGTETFLTQYAGTAPYCLRPIFQANGGPARARNAGVQAACGEIIVFIDDDVEPVPEFLAIHAAHHRTDPKIVVIGPMSPDPKRAEPPWIAWEHAMLEKQYFKWRTGVWKQAWPNQFYSGNASVRRGHVLSVGGFDENFKRQEDVELAYRLERECGVHYIFDASADGLHRPVRTFGGWLNVPTAYGQLDVVRARRGDASWDVVCNSYRHRNLATRALADMTLQWPMMASPIRSVLLAGGKAAYKMRLSGAALGAFSVIYNLRYLESAQQEMGVQEMRSLLKNR